MAHNPKAFQALIRSILDGKFNSKHLKLANLGLTDSDLDLLFTALVSRPDVAANIETLNLSGNRLTNVKIPYVLKNLEELHLQSNQIANLELPENLVSLRVLDIRHNRISSLPLHKNFVSLTTLRLEHNSLTILVLHPAYTKLNTVSAENNLLHNVVISPNTYRQLRSLRLSNNPLSPMSNLSILSSQADLPRKHTLRLPQFIHSTSITIDMLRSFFDQQHALKRSEAISLPKSKLQIAYALVLPRVLFPGELGPVHSRLSSFLMPSFALDIDLLLERFIDTLRKLKDKLAPNARRAKKRLDRSIAVIYTNENNLRQVAQHRAIADANSVIRHNNPTITKVADNLIAFNQFVKISGFKICEPPKLNKERARMLSMARASGVADFITRTERLTKPNRKKAAPVIP